MKFQSSVNCFNFSDSRNAVVPPVALLVGVFLLVGPAQSQACDLSGLRYASSTNNLYIEKPGECTLSDLATLNRPDALELVDATNGIWLLKSNLIVKNGGTLTLRGLAKGGDVDEFRMLSNPGLDGFIRLEINYGDLMIDGVTVRSWDETVGDVDTDQSDGRPYIKARSFKDKVTGQINESTVDVIDSDIGYLGYKNNESYGLSLKIKAKRDEQHLFEEMDIFGSVINSRIHHNNMGFYSWGSYGVEIRDSEFDNNSVYGVDPHDHSDALIIDNNYVHDNGSHGIICSTDCTDLVITNNVVENNRHGIMLHQNVTNSLVEGNTLSGNREVGIALYHSHNNIVRNNDSRFNEDGIRLSAGSTNNLVENNTVSDNTRYSFYQYAGLSLPPETDGRNENNVFVGNTILADTKGVKFLDSDSTRFENNVLGAATKFYLEGNVGAQILNNDFSQKLEFKNYDDFQMSWFDNQAIKIKHPGNRLMQAATPFDTDSFPSYVTDSRTSLTLRNPGSQTVVAQVQGLDTWVVPNIGEIRALPRDDAALGKGVELKSSELDQEVAITFGGLNAGERYEVNRELPPSSGSKTYPTHQLVADSQGEIEFTLPLTGASSDHKAYVRSSAAQNNTEVRTAFRDGYVRAGTHSDANFGFEERLAVKTDSNKPNNHRQALMAFDISGADIVSQATIQFEAKLHKAGSVDLVAQAVAENNWVESGLTWNSFPVVSGNVGNSVLNNTSYQTVSIDVTDYINAEIQGGKDQVSVALTGAVAASSIVYIRSIEYDGASSGSYAGARLVLQP